MRTGLRDATPLNARRSAATAWDVLLGTTWVPGHTIATVPLNGPGVGVDNDVFQLNAHAALPIRG